MHIKLHITLLTALALFAWGSVSNATIETSEKSSAEKSSAELNLDDASDNFVSFYGSLSPYYCVYFPNLPQCLYGYYPYYKPYYGKKWWRGKKSWYKKKWRRSSSRRWDRR